MLKNRVRDARTQKEYSRDELAACAGITRQSIGLIEAGRVVPSTAVALRLSRALGCTVEYLFREEPEEVTVDAHLVQPNSHDRERPMRTYIGSVRGKPVARPVQIGNTGALYMPAQGIASPEPDCNGKTAVKLLDPSLSIEKTVFISGCDLGLGLLVNYIPRVSSSYRGVWFNAPNQKALQELKEGVTHIAAVHYSDRLADHLSDSIQDPVEILRFARSEMGWMVAKGNPHGFAEAADLGGGRLRLINRQQGAGARRLLDRELQRAAVDPSAVPGYAFEAAGHYGAAEAVQQGFADAGIGHAGAAFLFGLDFIPIQTEQCALVIPEAYMEMDAVRVIVEALHSDVFLEELSAFGPYDVQASGSRMPL